MKTQLASGEHLIKEGSANQFKGLEGVGGNLYLTGQRLIFESHALNIQTGVTIVPLAQIAGVGTGWSKLFGLIPLMPNLLMITTTANEELKFVVYGKAEWQTSITALLQK